MASNFLLKALCSPLSKENTGGVSAVVCCLDLDPLRLSFTNQLIIVFQFYSANCFMSLFWIAFVRQNMEELRVVSSIFLLSPNMHISSFRINIIEALSAKTTQVHFVSFEKNEKK